MLANEHSESTVVASYLHAVITSPSAICKSSKEHGCNYDLTSSAIVSKKTRIS